MRHILTVSRCGVVTLHVGVKIAFFFVSMPENAYSFFFMFPNGLAQYVYSMCLILRV
jgi:hypothetical protein